MIVVTYKINESLLERKEVMLATPCSCCKNAVGNINIIKIDVTALFRIVHQRNIRVDLTCAACNKNIKSKFWNEQIKFLVKEKKKEYKLSFFKKYGRSLGLVVGILILFFCILIFQNLSTLFNASQNFSKAYGVEASKKWYEALENCDFLLCNKNYKDDAQVFQIVNISGDEVVVKAFDQYFSYGSYEELGKLNKLPLGDAPFVLKKIQKGILMKNGYVKDVSESVLSLNYLNIVQIRKAK